MAGWKNQGMSEICPTLEKESTLSRAAFCMYTYMLLESGGKQEFKMPRSKKAALPVVEWAAVCSLDVY